MGSRQRRQFLHAGRIGKKWRYCQRVFESGLLPRFRLFCFWGFYCWHRREFQVSESFGNVEVWLRSVGWLPGRIEAWLGGSFYAEEIDVPDGGIEMFGEAFHGDGQFGGPRFFSFVDIYAAL